MASQVVTEIDRAAESLILEMLTDSVGNGNIGLLTEETQDDGSRFEKDFFFIHSMASSSYIPPGSM